MVDLLCETQFLFINLLTQKYRDKAKRNDNNNDNDIIMIIIIVIKKERVEKVLKQSSAK